MLATCPYCKEGLARREREGVVRCPSCETTHHTPCWSENGGCTILGCGRAGSSRLAPVRTPREEKGA
ncbi:hypothetical protein HY251_02450 [bacterium]|nr:hypothetical protein [bacterium]